MMADMVNWCTDNGIITNTRGSAAGSLVSYSIGITTVDPIKYLLPFERFLNPLRPKAPDIDLDIADDRRGELIAHIVEKYGQDKVAQICTFGRMLARGAVRDIARVMGQPYAFGDRVAKVVPVGSQGFPMTIEKALTESPELKTMYDTDPAVKQVVDLGREIEGNARHASVHAAGIVVSPTPMTEYTPLQLEPKGEKIITQYEMHACEDVGLVKFDILGIRNLSILGSARDTIERERQLKIDLDRLPQDDKKTFAMLARGETMGVFQLGGSGMTKWLKELKPNRLEDIMVMIALFRPGPMNNIQEFIARKHGKVPVKYLHPSMAKFLDKSYGILVYQDDILFMALELAGYDWASVDALRQAIGKKKPKEMA
ncbi:MAG TPA: DNA polymerase III subunit alpha, partial [Niastella sp.]|nr:DNA polymerase III subunit alpha [Niastella sp.]